MIQVDLRSEAVAEADRVARSRGLLCSGDEETLAQMASAGPWIAVARSASLRGALRARALQLWQLAIEDANGRLVESTLVAVSVDGSAAVSDIVACVDEATVSWRDETMCILERFAATRLSRERAIRAEQDAPIAPAQRGLFDRRADRAHAERLSAQASAIDEESWRLAAVQRTATFSPRPARLVLSLLPRR